MSRQQRKRLGADCQNVRYFVPAFRKAVETLERGAPLLARECALTHPALYGTGELDSRPGPGDDSRIIGKP